MSSKKLKLNLEHQITANDTNREEDLIDNIDPSSSSSADNDTDHEEGSCRTRFYEKRDTSYYLLIDSDILETVIQTIGRCPIDNCCGKVKLKNKFSKKMGLSCNLELSCAICEWQTNILTSKKIPTSRAFDINLHSIIAFRENGKGHTGLESVCSYLNLVPPMNKNAYNKLLLTAKSSYKKTAEICMKTAADEVRCLVAEEKHDTVSENSNITTIENCSDGTDSSSLQNSVVDDEFIVDTAVSSDGTWQKRGYDSLNGIVTVIQNDVGKCVDFRVISKKCTACASWEKRQGTIEYEKFIFEHDCLVNHSASAGSMEVIGVVECFQSSVKDRKLRYTQLIGDGDSKT